MGKLEPFCNLARKKSGDKGFHFHYVFSTWRYKPPRLCIFQGCEACTKSLDRHSSPPEMNNPVHRLGRRFPKPLRFCFLLVVFAALLFWLPEFPMRCVIFSTVFLRGLSLSFNGLRGKGILRSRDRGKGNASRACSVNAECDAVRLSRPLSVSVSEPSFFRSNASFVRKREQDPLERSLHQSAQMLFSTGAHPTSSRTLGRVLAKLNRTWDQRPVERADAAESFSRDTYFQTRMRYSGKNESFFSDGKDDVDNKLMVRRPCS